MAAWLVPVTGDAADLAFTLPWVAPAVGDQVGLELGPGLPPIPGAVRHTGRSAGLAWDKKPRRARSDGLAFVHAARKHAHMAPPWAMGHPRSAQFMTAWGVVPRKHSRFETAWDRSPVKSIDDGLDWLKIPRKSGQTETAWGIAERVNAAANLPWLNPPERRLEKGFDWLHALKVHTSTSAGWLHADVKKGEWWLPWKKAKRVEWHVGSPGVEPGIPQPPIGSWYVPPGDQAGLNFLCHFHVDEGDQVAIRFAPFACYGAIPKPRTYTVLNSASVVRLPERSPVAVSSLSISASAEDAFQSVRMDLADPSALNLLVSTGDPKEIEVNVNGYVFTFIVEDWDRDQAFPAVSTSVSGRSRTALLDAPYAPSRSYVLPADAQAQQLADAEVDLSGFTIDYDTLTWLVPAFAFAYEGKTPIAALSQIAQASGAVLQSHRFEKTVSIRPRYPASPWAWPVTAPDRVLVDDYISKLGRRDSTSGAPVFVLDLPLWAPTVPGKPGLIQPLDLVEFTTAAETVKGQCLAWSIDVSNTNGALVVTQSVSLEVLPAEPKFNFVLVSGEQVGVSAPVIREGSAGDVKLPQIVDPLIVTEAVMTERGRNALSGGGDGVAKSNLWRSLSASVGPTSRYIKGNVFSVEADGTLVVATSDGAYIRARPQPDQTLSPGAGVFVQDGRVVDTAPALPGTTQYV